MDKGDPDPANYCPIVEKSLVFLLPYIKVTVIPI